MYPPRRRSFRWILTEIPLSIESLLTTTDGAYIETDPENSTWTKSGDSETGAFDVGVSVTETVDDTEDADRLFFQPEYAGGAV